MTDDKPINSLDLEATDRGIDDFLTAIFDTVHDLEATGWSVKEIRFGDSKHVKIYYKTKESRI